MCERFADDDRDAALALARWCALGDALAKHGGSDELRFRRRAYERVRNRALVAIALREAAGSPPTGTNTSRVRS